MVWACDDKVENPAMSVTPSDYLQLADTGEIVHYIVNASGYKGNNLKTFKITWSTETSATQTFLDSTLSNTSSLYYEFDFKVPQFTDTTEISLIFYIADADGNYLKVKRVLWVQTYSESGTLLTEYSGNTIYSDPNYHGNAFDLLNCKLLSSGYSDSSQMHIMTVLDTTNTEKLTRKWISPAGLKFVSFSGLNYASASEQTVKAAYEAGIKMDFISNISENDIYLTKISSSNSTKYIVIRVMNVYDNTGSENDMYIFNVKK
jgi:hypothetical protein